MAAPQPESTTPMSDMLGDDLTRPLPEGFDLGQWINEIGEEGVALYNAIPVFIHPVVAHSTNETYWEFGRLRKRMGLGPDSENDTQYDIIRATCEYLIAQTGSPPALTDVAAFLGRGWQPVLQQLESYPPVVPLLAYSQYLVTCNPDSPWPHRHIESAVQTAKYYVLSCLAFSEEQVQDERNATERRAFEQEYLGREKKWKRDALIIGVVQVLLGAALACGGFGLGVWYATEYYLKH